MVIIQFTIKFHNTIEIDFYDISHFDLRKMCFLTSKRKTEKSQYFAMRAVEISHGNLENYMLMSDHV